MGRWLPFSSKSGIEPPLIGFKRRLTLPIFFSPNLALHLVYGKQPDGPVAP